MVSTKTYRQLAYKEFIASADQLGELRKLIRDQLGNEGFESEFVERMVLAVNEACMNIIQHGYGNSTTGCFKVEILTNDDNLTFRLTDSAPKLNLGEVEPRDLNDIRPGGLGVHFINQLMDKVEFLETKDESGNLLQMTKTIE